MEVSKFADDLLGNTRCRCRQPIQPLSNTTLHFFAQDLNLFEDFVHLIVRTSGLGCGLCLCLVER